MRTQSNLCLLHPKPRDLLLGQFRVTQQMAYSGPQESSDYVTQSNPHWLHPSSWDSPAMATRSNPAHATFWTTGEQCWGELKQSGMPSQGPQYHAAIALPEGPRAPPFQGARATQRIACQRALDFHRELDTRGTDTLKQTTEGPDLWEKGIKLRAEKIKA